MNSKIRISVLMGIYNCADTLADAIESILVQTVQQWELIMCDDGSTDKTYDIASEFSQKYPDKIVVLKNTKNRGLNYTLNKCLSVARGEYIARMDGDDLCAPNRFEKELKAFSDYPQVAIVSTAMEYFDENGVWGSVNHPEFVTSKDFLRGTPFCHAPCMVRTEAIKFVGGYSESKWLLRVEDYHLWIKMYAAGYKGINLKDVLYQMRDDRNAYQRRKFRYRLNEFYVRLIAVRQLNLPIWGYIYAVRPIIVGLLPTKLYDVLHKRNLKLED